MRCPNCNAIDSLNSNGRPLSKELPGAIFKFVTGGFILDGWSKAAKRAKQEFDDSLLKVQDYLYCNACDHFFLECPQCKQLASLGHDDPYNYTEARCKCGARIVFHNELGSWASFPS